MKIITTSILILLGITSFAQQNYFSKRYTFGCGQNGQKIIQDGPNYTLISSVSCLGIGLRSVFATLDSTGNVIIEKAQGAEWHDYYSGGYSGLIKLQDSTYVFAGGIDDTTFQNDVLLYKLSKEGDSIWIREYGDTAFQSGWQSKQTRDHGFIITGQTCTFDQQGDVLLIKTDSNGIEQWQKHYGGTGYDLGLAIDTCIDGGFIITGYTNSYGIGGGSEFGNAWVIKTDSLGNVRWTKTFGGIYDDAFWNGISCHDGSFAFAGYFTFYDPFYPRSCCTNIAKLYVLRLDSAGNTIFEKTYGRQYDINNLFSIKELTNGDLITAGWYVDTLTRHERGVILKTNSLGDSLWLHTYEFLHGPNSGSHLFDIAPTQVGGYIAIGYIVPAFPDTGNADTWVLKVDSNGCEISNCLINSTGNMDFLKANNSFNVYPNPSMGVFHFENDYFDEVEKVEVFTYTGQCVYSKEGKSEEFDLSLFPNGIYFYKIITKEKKNWAGRIVKISDR